MSCGSGPMVEVSARIRDLMSHRHWRHPVQSGLWFSLERLVRRGDPFLTLTFLLISGTVTLGIVGCESDSDGT